jgi:hypothetical protein
VTLVRYTVELRDAAGLPQRGFRLTRHFVLTADHRLGATLGENESVELWLAPGERITGTVEQRCDEADLALIRLYGEDLPSPEVYFDQARSGETWTAANGTRVLRGTVRKAATLRHTTPGLAPVEVMELELEGGATDDARRRADRLAFDACAGGPIERYGASPIPVVLGIAVRLGDDGHGHSHGEERPPMTAATVKEALRRFRALRLAELVDGMWPGSADGQESAMTAAGPLATHVDPFTIEELPESSPASYRDKYHNQVLRRLAEYGIVTPVPITDALGGDLTSPGADDARGARRP